MSHDERAFDLRRRLEELEKRLAEKEAEIGRSGNIPPHHQMQIDELCAKAGAVRQKLQDRQNSAWQAAKHDLEADMEALAHSFERWVKQVDEEYRRSTS